MWIREWSARHLVASWLAYWAGLLAVVGWRPLTEYWRLQRADAHGEVSLAYSGSLLTLSLWVAGPPLLLFLVWLGARARGRSRRPESPPVA